MFPGVESAATSRGGGAEARVDRGPVVDTGPPVTLSEAFPGFLPELRALLERAGLSAIAEQADGLELAGRCRCGDELCSTFYVKGCRSPLGPEEQSGRDPDRRGSHDLEPEEGFVIVDTDHLGRLTTVEVLGRPDVEAELRAALAR